MRCKVACYTPAGWFFWEDELFSNQESAYAFIAKQKEYVQKDLFLVFPDRVNGWGRKR